MAKTKEQISHNMSSIRGKDTHPELVLRRALYKKGLRYYKNYSGLIGHPDIFFKRAKICVFIDGDFWHGHFFSKQKEQIKTNRSYWIPKIEKNIQRDQEETLELEKEGYTVIRVWEDEIKKDLPRIADIIYQQVKSTKNPYKD